MSYRELPYGYRQVTDRGLDGTKFAVRIGSDWSGSLGIGLEWCGANPEFNAEPSKMAETRRAELRNLRVGGGPWGILAVLSSCCR